MNDLFYLGIITITLENILNKKENVKISIKMEKFNSRDYVLKFNNLYITILNFKVDCMNNITNVIIPFYKICSVSSTIDADSSYLLKDTWVPFYSSGASDSSNVILDSGINSGEPFNDNASLSQDTLFSFQTNLFQFKLLKTLKNYSDDKKFVNNKKTLLSKFGNFIFMLASYLFFNKSGIFSKITHNDFQLTIKNFLNETIDKITFSKSELSLLYTVDDKNYAKINSIKNINNVFEIDAYICNSGVTVPFLKKKQKQINIKLAEERKLLSSIGELFFYPYNELIYKEISLSINKLKSMSYGKIIAKYKPKKYINKIFNYKVKYCNPTYKNKCTIDTSQASPKITDVSKLESPRTKIIPKDSEWYPQCFNRKKKLNFFI